MLADSSAIAAAVAAVRQHWPVRPRVGLILGSGLGALARHMRVASRLNYEEIPHFLRATAPGHSGKLLCGTLGRVPIVALDGRIHLYEGYTPQQVTFGVRVMKALGIELLIVSNACGGMNPNFEPGDVMVIEDHVNFMFRNPLVGPHDPTSGLGYPDLSRPYDPELIERALAIGRRENFAAYRGVYVGVIGPNYETRAEYRMFRRFGGDAVGMSTVPEVIVAAQCGLRVLALSVVTNVCLPDRLQPADAQQVIAVAASAEPKVRAIVLGILAELATG